MELPTPTDVTDGLIDELTEVIYKYEGAMLLSTAVGALELVKLQLIVQMHKEINEDKDEDDN
tara:strand:- start:1799 stop:1984 length:186 start_codon:yes stop_codon:yes gene_type:complete